MTALLPARIVSLSLRCPTAEPAGGGAGTVVVDACLRGNCEAFTLPTTKNADVDVRCACECRFKGRLLEGAQRETTHTMKLPELWGYFRAVSAIL